jgi:hypothetical protein
MEIWLAWTIAGLWLAGLGVVVVAMASGRRRAAWDDFAMRESDFRLWELELRTHHRAPRR